MMMEVSSHWSQQLRFSPARMCWCVLFTRGLLWGFLYVCRWPNTFLSAVRSGSVCVCEDSSRRQRCTAVCVPLPVHQMLLLLWITICRLMMSLYYQSPLTCCVFLSSGLQSQLWWWKGDITHICVVSVFVRYIGCFNWNSVESAGLT